MIFRSTLMERLMKENNFSPPEYRGLKVRCDFCDRAFHPKESIAACAMKIEGAKVPYVLIFCFDKKGELWNQHCLQNWCTDYEVSQARIPMLTMMKFRGKGRGDNTGGSLAYV